MFGSKGHTRRIYLHVGLPKTGTTFVQDVLAANRGRLRKAGLLYPLPYRQAMFHAAVELRGGHERWGLDPDRIKGTWERLCGRMRGFDGSSLFSHEILSSATPEQVARVHSDLQGLDVHVVVTARDLRRQIPAVWQESVKSGSTTAFSEVVRRIGEDLEAGTTRQPFWSLQNLPKVLSSWGAHVPPENVHLVPTPRPGADRLELWRRFADAVGIDPDAYPTETGRFANESLGAAQSALLRDVNEVLEGRIDRPGYIAVVKRFFAQKVLPRQQSARLSLPPDLEEPVRERSEQWVETLAAAGYTVHGDLQDLLPAPPEPSHTTRGEVPPEDRYGAATAAIADLLTEIRQLHEELTVYRPSREQGQEH